MTHAPTSGAQFSSSMCGARASNWVARAYTGREKIIKFEGHYHGWFDNVLVSVHPPLEAMGPYEAPHPVPGSAGQARSALEDVMVLPWNDLAVLEGVLFILLAFRFPRR